MQRKGARGAWETPGPGLADLEPQCRGNGFSLSCVNLLGLSWGLSLSSSCCVYQPALLCDNAPQVSGVRPQSLTKILLVGSLGWAQLSSPSCLAGAHLTLRSHLGQLGRRLSCLSSSSGPLGLLPSWRSSEGASREAEGLPAAPPGVKQHFRCTAVMRAAGLARGRRHATSGQEAPENALVCPRAGPQPCHCVLLPGQNALALRQPTRFIHTASDSDPRSCHLQRQPRSSSGVAALDSEAHKVGSDTGTPLTATMHRWTGTGTG